MTTERAMVPANQSVDLTIQDIKTYICPAATDAEAYMFLRLCLAQGLNPYLREAYLIKYGNNPATMVVGKDAFTKRAEQHPQFDGFRAGVIIDRKGEIIEREGAFVASGETLVGGWAEVYRKDRRVPHKVTVSLDEYDPKRPELGNKLQWNVRPATMIRKVPLVQALREDFPAVFQGLYDASEMGISDDALEGEIIRREEPAAPQPPRQAQRPAARAINVPPTAAAAPVVPPLTDEEREAEAEMAALLDASLTAFLDKYNTTLEPLDGWLVRNYGAAWGAMPLGLRQSALMAAQSAKERQAAAKAQADQTATTAVS